MLVVLVFLRGWKLNPLHERDSKHNDNDFSMFLVFNFRGKDGVQNGVFYSVVICREGVFSRLHYWLSQQIIFTLCSLILVNA
jgi:uncharacterized membrane protein